MNAWGFMKVSDGARTRDRLDHNQELYQLSYAHRVARNLTVRRQACSENAGTRLDPEVEHFSSRAQWLGGQRSVLKRSSSTTRRP